MLTTLGEGRAHVAVYSAAAQPNPGLARQCDLLFRRWLDESRLGKDDVSKATKDWRRTMVRHGAYRVVRAAVAELEQALEADDGVAAASAAGAIRQAIGVLAEFPGVTGRHTRRRVRLAAAQATEAGGPQAGEAAAGLQSGPWAGEKLRRISYDAMRLVRDVGDVVLVSRWLANPEVLARGEEDGEAAAGIAEAREWLAGALEHERVHGAGSAIDRTHPFWVNGLEPARLRGEEIRRRKAAAAAVQILPGVGASSAGLSASASATAAASPSVA